LSVEDKIDKLHDKIDKLYGVLAGDEFNDGLVKEVRTLKERFYATREQVRKIWIIGGLLSAIFGGLLSIVSFFNDIFGE